MGLAGIILAAGESTRMGRDKALLAWPPADPNSVPHSCSTLLSRAIDTFSAVCDLVIVVVGTNEAALAPVIYASGAFVARNNAPERGQFSSLQIGLREVLNRGRDSAIITLVDRPAPTVATVEELTSAFMNRGHGIWAVIPEYQGRHGHPILVGRELIEEFLKAPLSANAREIEHSHQPRIEYLAVDSPFVTMNINTVEDYASLKSEA